MKTVARLSAEDRSDLFRNTANRIQPQMKCHGFIWPLLKK